MKTEDLIRLMSEDAPSGPPIGRRLAYALLAGLVVAVFLLITVIGLRHNLGEALQSARVLAKIVIMTLLALVTLPMIRLAGLPGQSPRSRLGFILLPVGLLMIAMACEVCLVPLSQWPAAWLGHYPHHCLTLIPLLSLAPLTGILVVLKSGAPDNPGEAGFFAGLTAGAIAAAVYAWHCPDDSPFFGATWYSLAIGADCLAGYLIGRRLLRW